MGAPADIWALEMTLYVILMGSMSFTGDFEADLYMRIQRGKVKLPSSLSPEACKLIKKMLHTDPHKRPTAQKVFSDPWLRINN